MNKADGLRIPARARQMTPQKGRGQLCCIVYVGELLQLLSDLTRSDSEYAHISTK